MLESNCKYKLTAPAKINIGLMILDKRKDEFHNLETVFYPINLCDDIVLEIYPDDRNRIEVSVQNNPLLNNQKNICYKAVELFFREFNIKGLFHIKVNINKKIPVGGGLGGGSSDAAAVIKALAKHFKKSTQTKRLNKIALSLGSDVPFFMLNKPALGSSRGEKLKVLNNFKIKGKILLVNPGIAVSTKWAFGEVDRRREKLDVRSWKLELRNFKYKITSNQNKSSINLNSIENDFEGVVFKKYPEIKAIKDKMIDNGALFASMSGSGSSVYGIFRRVPKELEKYYKEKGYGVFVV